MTQLSRLVKLGWAKESVVGTYVVPAVYLPFMKADHEDVYSELKDESYRYNDSVLQGMYQGPVEAVWDIDMLAYPDLIGHFLRAIIGPDTVTAATSTTLSSSSSIGATSLSVAASIASGTYIQIDTATNLEYAKVTNVTGSGPYTLTVTGAGLTGGLLNAHASSVAVVSTTTHTFKQNALAAKATYSLTVDDTAGNVLGYTAATASDLQIKIDPKAIVSANLKMISMPGVTQSGITPTYTSVAPNLGWEWVMTNAGGTSDRGLTYDVTVKRAVEAIHSSNGVQAPREIFQGALEADGSYKALFSNNTDLNLYLQYTQTPTTATVTQPVAQGGMSLALTMSKSGWFKGKRDYSGSYVQADFSLSGIWNSTDSGSVSAVLNNYQTTAY